LISIRGRLRRLLLDQQTYPLVEQHAGARPFTRSSSSTPKARVSRRMPPARV
jgi:hypothetical protein